MALLLRLLLLPIACVLMAVATISAQTGGRLNVPVNDSLNDYAPVVFYSMDENGEDILYFTSDRTDVYDQGKKIKKARRAEIWHSTRPAAYRKTKPLNAEWGQPACTLLSTTDKMFAEYTRGTPTTDTNRTLTVFAAEHSMNPDGISAGNTSHMLDLWSTTDNFVTLTPLSKLNSDYWESQPALTPDGRMLFFTSNRPVVLNGSPDSSLNIFYSINNGGNWSDPVLVPTMNTPGDEISPHCGADGYFYFSSNWKNNTTADFDIYRASFNAAHIPVRALLLEESLRKASRRAIPSDLPYNSAANDMFAYVTPDKRGLFFTSDRDGAKLDIYTYSFPDPEITLEVTVLGKTVTLNNDTTDAPPPDERFLLQLSGDGNREFKPGEVIPLAPASNYIVRASTQNDKCLTCELMPKQLTFRTGIKDSLLRDTFYIICRQQPDSAIIIRDSISGTPYFITGYWWPTTSENLQVFHERVAKNSLQGSHFIDSTDYRYDEAAPKIDDYFKTHIYAPIEEALVRLSSQCWGNPVLKITVHGYTDECRLRPGIYSADSDVTVGGIIIPRGQYMQSRFAHSTAGMVQLLDSGQNGNIFLSKLRAYYTAQTIQNYMSSSSKTAELFNHMKEKKQVVFDFDGFGIFGRDKCDALAFPVPDMELPADPLFEEPCNKPRSRLFIVYISVLNSEEEAAAHIITRCGVQRWKNNRKPKPKNTMDRRGDIAKVNKNKGSAPLESTAEITPGSDGTYSIQYGIISNTDRQKTAEVILTTLGFHYKSEIIDGVCELRSEENYQSEQEAQAKLDEYINKTEIIRDLLQPKLLP